MFNHCDIGVAVRRRMVRLMMILAANFGLTLSEMNLITSGLIGTASNAWMVFYNIRNRFDTPGAQLRSNKTRYIPS